MAKVITEFAEMTNEITTKKCVIFDQDEKEYGRAVGYISSKGIYVYYKSINEFKFLTVFFTKDEIKDKFNAFNNGTTEDFEMFDCPDFNPRRIYLSKDTIILKENKRSKTEIYKLDLKKIIDKF